MYGLSDDDELLDSTKILGDNFRIHHNYFEGFIKMRKDYMILLSHHKSCDNKLNIYYL